MFFLFTLLGLMSMAAPLDDDIDTGEDTDPIPDDDPVLDPDLGASVIENPDGSLHIELGEDETGDLVAIKFNQTGDGEDFTQHYDLGIYLAPEGTELPIDPTGQSLQGYESPEDFIEAYGLTEVVSFDLGSLTQPTQSDEDPEDTRVDPPVITSDDPMDIIRLNYAYGDGGEPWFWTETDETLSPFETPGVFYNGVESQTVSTDFTGSAGTDFVITEPDAPSGLSIDGGDGEDVLLVTSAHSSASGGADDDIIYTLGDQSQALGGEGDDDIYVGTNGHALGGDGDDKISYIGDTDGVGINDYYVDLPTGTQNLGTTMSGGEGNDSITAAGENVVAYGDAGEDRLFISDGAVGDGGGGNDEFHVAEFYDDIEETVVLTGGTGADDYTISVRNLDSSHDGMTAQIAQITDFDPDEDTISLSAGYNTSITGAQVVEDPDGAYSDLVIELKTDFQFGEPRATATVTVRLDGVTGYSAGQLLA
ncbi:phytase [Actibacterium atlanticum]|uniref:Phytase n=1 Tax=Actibacterium atlanticum TaxID=1461693 RepID=A0A058ZPL5_9RHOB|nr:hypothetical protein [Actibacterium atlanticum]KCV83523.1 phytase [Actibacterium atlanticum]